MQLLNPENTNTNPNPFWNAITNPCITWSDEVLIFIALCRQCNSESIILNYSREKLSEGLRSHSMLASFKRHLDASLMNSVQPCSKKRPEMMNNKEMVVPFSNRDFSGLPTDVLSVIIKKLFCPSDLVWFGAVCVNWRYALIQNPDKHFKFPSSLPLLLLSSPSSSSMDDEEDKNNITNTTTRIRLSSLYDGKIHEFPSPIIGNFCGSSHGWLVVATGANHNYSVKLLNPFLSFNNEIQLPSATTFKLDPYDEVFLEKAVLSASPSSSSSSNRGTGEVVVMAIHGLNSRLSYCKPGDNAWTALPFERINSVRDVIYCKGLFYAILHTGVVLTIEVPAANHLDITPKINVITNPCPPPQVAEHFKARAQYFTEKFLVESSGEILQVKMRKMLIMEDCSMHCSTLGFQVFKLAEDCSKTTNNHEEYRWVETQCLDGSSLFISHNVSISLSASDFPGCRPNCIYFTENYDRRLECRHFEGIHNIAIYNLEDMSFHQRPTSSQLTRCRFSLACSNPIWIQPTL